MIPGNLSRFCPGSGSVSVNRPMGGVVALSVEYRTCDQEVVGSSLGRARGVKTLGMFLTPIVPLFTKQYKLVPAKGR